MYNFAFNSLNTKKPGLESKDSEALENIIERLVQKEKQGEITSLPDFPTAAFESRFKSCLSRVPLDCRTETAKGARVIALRPKNVTKFDELIKTSGLANCDAATQAVRWLQSNPKGYLRFISH